MGKTIELLNFTLHGLFATGKTVDELRQLQVEGTTFNPTQGSIPGLSSLDRNLEVGTWLTGVAILSE